MASLASRLKRHAQYAPWFGAAGFALIITAFVVSGRSAHAHAPVPAASSTAAVASVAPVVTVLPPPAFSSAPIPNVIAASVPPAASAEPLPHAKAHHTHSTKRTHAPARPARRLNEK